jgi:ubiquinone/menaquinone biosynthesis C-methylase UbiE
MTGTDNSIEKYVIFSERLLSKMKASLDPGARVFDLGSGGGKLVEAFLDGGYECLGADLYGDATHYKRLKNLRKIESLDPYVLPFSSAEFDFSLSQNVLEHVQDYDATFAELSRIMKPGAYSLHMFPPKLTPIEQHVFVPGATIFQSYWYLYIWSWFSNLNPKWRGTERARLSWSEAAHRNQEFLKVGCNYLSGEEILVHARRHFSHASYADRYLFEFWPGKISKFNKLVKLFPFLLSIHSAFRMRVLLVQK